MSKDPNAPVTRLPNLYFTNTDNANKGLFVPSCTAAQVAAIPRSELSPGGLIFDTTAEELLTYTAAGFWIPILTAGSEIDLTNIVCDTLTASQTVFASESVSSANINGTNITCSTLLNYESITSPLITVTTGDFTNLNVTGVITCNNIVSSGLMSIGSLYASSLVSADSFTSTNGYTAGGPSFFKDTIVNGSLRTNLIAGQSPTNDISPITVVLDNGAGTGATGVVKGSIPSGTFTLNTGTISVANGYIGTFTIPSLNSVDFTGSFSVQFMPASLVTAAATAKIYIICNPGTNPPTFLVGVSGTLANTTQYMWNYQIIGNNKQ